MVRLGYSVWSSSTLRSTSANDRFTQRSGLALHLTERDDMVGAGEGEVDLHAGKIAALSGGWNHCRTALAGRIPVASAAGNPVSIFSL